MSIKRIALLLIIATLLLSGCGQQTPAAQAPAAATTAPAAPSDTPLPPTDTPTPTVNAAATQSAQQTADALATKDAAAKATADKQTQAVQDKQATATAKEGAKATEKAQVQATATAQVESYLATVNKLYDDGVLKTKEGKYYNLGEYEDSQARINTPFVSFLDFSPSDFIISADLDWESASDNANWPTSGCGFVYGYQDSHNADLTYAGLDGYTHSFQFRTNTGLRQYAFQKWGEPERPRGSASMMLVVSEKHVYVYMNDKLAVDFYNGYYKAGQLGLNIYSGTNKGFGTRCRFSNIQLFIMK